MNIRYVNNNNMNTNNNAINTRSSNSNTNNTNNNNSNNNSNNKIILNTTNNAYEGMNTKQCFDPLMANNSNIDPDSAILYILNNQKKVIRTVCLDETSLRGYLKNDDTLFYRCKPTVPKGALFIQPRDILPDGIRKIALDIIVYVYDHESKYIKPKRSYILLPTDEPVGRIASRSVVMGGTVVSADHCQTDYSKDFIYKIKEFRPQTGGKRGRRGYLKKTQKKKFRKIRGGTCPCALGGNTLQMQLQKQNQRAGYRATKRDKEYLKKWKRGESIGFTLRSSLRAKGLIARANGTKRVSNKYRH